MSKLIELDRDQSNFVDELVASGRFASADAAVQQGLVLLRAREGQLSAVRDAWRDGVESGDYEPLDATLDELAALYTARLQDQA